MGTLGSGVSLWVSQALTSIHGLEVVLNVQHESKSATEAGPASAWERVISWKKPWDANVWVQGRL